MLTNIPTIKILHCSSFNQIHNDIDKNIEKMSQANPYPECGKF